MGAVVPLRVIVGDRTYVFTQAEVTIGRVAEADVVVEVSDVSRIHGRVRWVDDHWHYIDNSSRNGTYMAGTRFDGISIDQPVRLNLAGRSGPELTLQPAKDLVTGSATTSRLAGEMAQVSAVHNTRMGRVKIGRAADNDIVVDDLEVSRHHAELRTAPDGKLAIADLGSHNGTFINGTQIDRANLEDNDLVTIGHHMFLVVAGTLQEFVDSGSVQFEALDLGVDLVGGIRILDNVSFTLPERSLVAVLGPSGSGKSTLLRALTGFSPATQGQVIYGGRDLYASYEALRQRIGYVPQDDILHPELTVREALGFAARLRFPPDVPSGDIGARVDEVIGELGLSYRADVAIGNLSGGQRKRASVGFELLTKPSLIFLDEPTSGLDPGYERALTGLLRSLADGGRTVIVVTHSVQSLDLCDRIVILAPGGRLAFFGPPAEAMAYFDCETYAEVYERLTDPGGPDWHSEYQGSPAFQTYVELPRAGSGGIDDAGGREESVPPRRRGWFRQYRTLTRRYASVIWHDRKLVTLLAMQAPLLALLMLVAMGADGLAPRTSIAFSGASLVLAVLVLAATWLGMSNAGREIAKESAIFRRERAIGLSASAYVASKATVLATITLAQTTILVLVGLARQGLTTEAALLQPAFLELAIGIGLSGIAAVSLGLLISALARTPDRAMGILPVVLILQLVVAGGFKEMAERPVLREISYLSSAQWGFSAAASTVDLNELQLVNDCVAEASSFAAREDIENDSGEVTEAADEETKDAATSLAPCALSDPALTQVLLPEDVQAGGSALAPSECVADLEGLDAAAVDRLSPAELDGALLCAVAHPEAAVASLTAGVDTAEVLAQRAGPVNDNHPFRFWEQTSRDWLIDILFLAGLTVAGLIGTWLVLRRRDREST